MARSTVQSDRRSPRVMLGLAEVAGYYRNLERGLRSLGVDAVLVDLGANTFGYSGGDVDLVLVRWHRALARARATTDGRQRLRRSLIIGVQLSLRLPLLIWAITRFDAFVFGFGDTFLLGRDLALLRWLGKRVVCVFHGSDIRPPYLDGSVMAADRGLTVGECMSRTRSKRTLALRCERRAHALVSHGPYSQFLVRPFVEFLAIGIPSVEPVPAAEAPAGPTVRVLHSPSHPAAKGTREIRAAVGALRSRGHAIDLVEIVGQPNERVLSELASCDFVIDQVYSDTPMAGFAAEAAAAGRPAVVGGYELEAVVAGLDQQRLPPTVRCRPSGLEAAVEALAVDADRRRSLGAAAHAFVRTQWSAEAVAQRFLDVLAGTVDPAWTCDPSGLHYHHGVGLPEERVRGLIADVVAAGGPGALGLDHVPDRRDRLLAWAAGSSAGELEPDVGP